MPEEPLQSLPAGAKVLSIDQPKVISELPADAKIISVSGSGIKPQSDFAGPQVGGDIEATLNDIVKTSKTKILDSERDVLKDILTNPNTTPEQAKEAIQTIQGYHPKFTNGRTSYYMKPEKNGVVVPKPLAYGERPPKGYDVASVWGNQKQANDDSWYTDMGKSLFNGMVGAVQGFEKLAQLGTIAATGEESNAINSADNVLNSLKFKKDEDLDKPLFNTDGITKWADLLDKDRFDFSPKALWGTMNMAAESVTSFLVPAAALGKIGTAVTGLEKLGVAGQRASAFTASFMQQLGENMDNAKEAGLKGRDVAAFAFATTVPQAVIDASLGLESKIFYNSFKKSETQLMKELGKNVEKNAEGFITEQGFKDLAKETTLQYGKLAKIGAKEIVKDAGKEMLQETGQDVIEKSAENLWDKLTPEDRAKFGTDALSPKAFGSYIQSGLAGFISGVPMAVASTNYKQKYNEQSLNAFKTVEQGPEAVKILKSNLDAALKDGRVSPEEHAQANFKIDAYGKYNEQTKDLPNLTPQDKKDVFEKSFNIEALKSEINIPKEDLDKLDPIAHAKINSKKKIIDGLQKSIDEILLRHEAQSETKLGQETINKVEKSMEPKEGEIGHKALLNKFKPKTPNDGEVDVKDVPSFKNADKYPMDYEVNNPKSQARLPMSKFTTVGWDAMVKNNALRVKQIVGEHLKYTPKNEMDVIIRSGPHNTLMMDLGDNKRMAFAQSAKSIEGKTPSYFKYDNLPKTKINIENKGGDTDPNNEGMPEYYYEEPVSLKRVEFPSIDKKTGEPIIKAVLVAYNKQSGDFIGYAREHNKGKAEYLKGDEVHLDNITKANYLSDEIKPYERGTKVIKKKAEPQKQSAQAAADFNEVPFTVKSFADDIAKGTVDKSPEAQEFYQNNKGEIEAELQKRAAEEKPKKFVPNDAGEVNLGQSKDVVTRIINKTIPHSFEDAVLRFFLSGGRIKTSDFMRFSGFGKKNERTGKTKGAKDFRGYIWAYSNKGENLDQLVRKLWTEDMDKDLNNADEIDLMNEFMDVLMGHSGKKSMANRLIEIQNQAVKNEANQGMSQEQVDYLNDLENAKDEYYNEREITPEEESDLAEAEKLRDKNFAETGQFQKESVDRSKDAFNVIQRLKKVAPKINWVYDPKLKVAGKVVGNTITINPYYAGKDTPIHEIGHVLIDSIGYNNKVIQQAIKQLMGTKLWEETASRYPELSEEMLGKEVLAEAIGREGEKIFDKEVDKNVFKKLLDYIYDKLKRLLGIDKNIAKTLARQIIQGRGTKNLVGENEVVQEQRKEYSDQKKIKSLIDTINKTENLSSLPYEDLVDAYNYVLSADVSTTQKDAATKNIMQRIALNLKERSVDVDKKNALSNDIKYKDITWLNTFMKVLSHFDEAFPEMKGLSKMFDEAIFNALESAEKQKFTHRKLAENVIKDYNKKLGIVQRAAFWAVEKFLDQKHKYFGFMDAGNGKLITVDQANAKGLSPAQVEYLKFTRETIAKRKGIDTTKEAYNADIDVLKLSKGTSETFQTEGFVGAIGSIVSNDNLGQVKIYFTNPKSGKKTLTEFKNVRQILTQQSKNGTVADKTAATKLMFKYAVDARNQFKKGYHADGTNKDFPKTILGKPSLGDDGQLKSRFDDNSYKGNTYSKDFFTAMNMFIDDTSHIENVSPLIPIINSIEYLAERGIVNEDGSIEHQKKNLAEWMKKWQRQHIFKSKEKIPVFDDVIKFLRHVTSMSTMMFNFKAQGLNVAVGQYSNFVEFGPKIFAKGLRRLFTGKERGVDADNAFGVVNKKMLDIANKYKAITVDLDSNPIRTGWGIFASLGFAGTKWGEVVNQVGALGGLMSDEDYNSFEYKVNEHGVKEIVVKGSLSEQQKKELEARILSHVNKVTDIHGKYGAKDRRNIMNNEFGQAVMQYRVWMPDVWRVRFGDKGRWTQAGKTAWKMMFKDGREEMMKAIRDDGGAVKHFMNDDVFKRNLRGAILTGTLLLLAAKDDDDNDNLERFLSDVLFIFDMDNMKFTISKPIPAAGTVERFLDALDHAAMNEADDFYKADGRYGDKGDSKLRGDLMAITPGKKLLNALPDDEE